MKNETNSRQIAGIFYLLLILLLSILSIIFDRNMPVYYSPDVIPMNIWTNTDGETVDLHAPPVGSLTLSADISPIHLNGRQLCLKSVDTVFDIYADGELIYSYRPEPPKLLGISYGMYIHEISLPENANSITMQIDSIFPDTPAYLREIAIEDGGMFMADLFKKKIPSFCRSVINMMIGILFLLLGLTNSAMSRSTGLDFLSFGALCTLLGFSGLNDTYLLQVLTQHPSIIRFVTYLCLMFIPCPSLKFIASATDNRKTWLLPVMYILCTGNCLLSLLLTYLGITDYYYTVLFSQAIIVLSFIAVFYLIAKAIRRKAIRPQLVRSLIAGTAAIVLGAGTDIVRYQLHQNGDANNSGFTKLGMTIFMIITSIYLFREQNRVSTEITRAEMMEKLAYTDGLTGLQNRLAFDRCEGILRNTAESCYILQFDINFLKRVNDVYGHAEGDKHIIAAATIIQECFTDIASCYRTGGDEFIVISRHECTLHEIDEALRMLEQRVLEYTTAETPPVPLQIAYGFAEYAPPQTPLDEAEHLADQRMYAKKRAMKAKDSSQSE